MNDSLAKKKLSWELFRKVTLILLLLVIAAIEICYRLQSEPSEQLNDIYNSLSRFLGSLVALIFMIEFSLGKILHPLGNRSAKALVFVIPALIIAVNNFPWVSFLTGDCRIDASVWDIAFYGVVCLCVGLFEELAFRGCAFMILLKNRTDTRLRTFMAIFWSSVLFGAVHLVNLFVSSPGAVLLQLGYSALIGGMCCLVLLETGNIWICVIIHAVYNFAGGVVPRFGEGIIWTGAEVAITALFGVAVAAFSVYRFLTMPQSAVKKLFYEKGKNI